MIRLAFPVSSTGPRNNSNYIQSSTGKVDTYFPHSRIAGNIS
jgi:hypothetical protein